MARRPVKGDASAQDMEGLLTVHRRLKAAGLALLVVSLGGCGGASDAVPESKTSAAGAPTAQDASRGAKECRGTSMYGYVDDNAPGFPSPEEAALARGPVPPGGILVQRIEGSMSYVDVMVDGERNAIIEVVEFANGWHVSGVEGCDLFRPR
jgi:hypothetical protein